MKRLLTVFLLISAFLVPCAAAQEETAPDNNMRFVSAMGIMDGTYTAEEALTRVKLAACYYNIMTKKADTAGFDDISFTDVRDIDRRAVALVRQYGIMNGVGDGKFAPDEPVTYAQLIKTMVVFLGYEARAVSEGGYPYGYISVANSLNLCKAPPASAEVYVTVNKAAELFRLSADVPLMKRTAYGNSEEYEMKNGETWLGMWLDAAKYRGTVTANHMTNLGGGEPVPYSRIMLNGTEFELNSNTVGLKNYIGYRADIYTDTSAEQEEVLYYEILAADTVDVNGSSIKSCSDGVIAYDEDGKTKRIKINNETCVLYNGAFCGNYSEKTINPFAESFLDGGITAVDNNRDGIFDLIEVDAYDTYVVSGVADGKIFNEYRKKAVIDTEALDEEELLITNVVGEEMWLSEIMPGDIISVSRTADGDVKKVVVTIDTLKGKITGISQGDEDVLEIDGITYGCSESLKLNPQLEEAEIGDTVKVFFNKDGKISDIETKQYKKYRLGYLADAGCKSSMGENYEMKIFASDGEFYIYPLAEKTEVEGKGRVTAKQAVELAGITSGGRSERQIIQYSINKETGELDYIDYCDGTEPVDSLYQYTGFEGLYYRDTTMSFSGKLLLSGETVIFTVPEEKNRDNDEQYYIQRPTIFASGIGYAAGYSSFRAYGNNKMSRRAAAMVLESSGKAYQLTYKEEMLLINTINYVQDEDGGSDVKVTGLCAGKETELLAEPDILKLTADGKLPRKGDVIRVVCDKNNYIKNAELIFCEETETLYNMTNPSAQLSENKRFAYGRVVYREEDFITVDVNGEEETHQISKYKLGCFDSSDANVGKAHIGTAADIYDEYHYPGIGSMVLIHTYNCQGKSIIVYNR